MPTSDSYHPYLIESLKDPKQAAAYIEAALEEGEPELLQLALRNVAEARDEMGKLQEQTKLPREKLDQMLSGRETFEVYSLGVLLEALGFKLTVALK